MSIETRKSVVFASASLILGCTIALAQSVPPTSVPKAETSSASGPQSASAPHYEVASIRQNLNPEPSWKMEFTDNGVSAKDVTLLWAMDEAYFDTRWENVPAWIKEKRFDIEAKFDVEKYPHPTLEQHRAMLRQLLAERFQLAIHHQPKEFPIYELLIAKGGPKFKETKPDDMIKSSTYGIMCHFLRSRPGTLEIQGCSMQNLADALSGMARQDLGRPVIDHTGLNGRYSFAVIWSPETPHDASSATNPLDTGAGPTIFTAVQEQLGLTLKPDKSATRYHRDRSRRDADRELIPDSRAACIILSTSDHQEESPDA